jgi:hypothetical protein
MCTTKYVVTKHIVSMSAQTLHADHYFSSMTLLLLTAGAVLRVSIIAELQCMITGCSIYNESSSSSSNR